jgi:hypothetical protein
LNPKAVWKVLNAISENKRLHNVKVDISENNLGVLGAPVIAKAIQFSKNIASYDVR